MSKNSDLDELLLDVLNLAERYQQLQSSEAQSLRNGFLNLAKYKVSHGIDPCSFDYRMSSNHSILTKDDQFNLVKDASKKDPLLWFSYLPPQSLKDAQADFQKSLKIMIEAINTAHELNCKLKDFFKLVILYFDFDFIETTSGI